MKKCLFQKILFCFAAFSILFSFAACSENKETDTATLTAEETTATEGNTTESWDITGKIKIFAAKSESGTLTKSGESTLTEIESAEDLAPFRHLFSDLDQAKEKALLEDAGGRLILMEIVQSKKGFSYFCNFVCRYDGVIEVCLSEAEDEEAQKHQYYLFYFPSDVYNLEDIRMLFV